MVCGRNKPQRVSVVVDDDDDDDEEEDDEEGDDDEEDDYLERFFEDILGGKLN